jgi:DNA-binding transcriptional MerR regulator
MNSESAAMPIGAVTQITGISSHTLRKWESRHHAVEPIRTESGRRLYTEAHVHRLCLLRDLVRQGHQISRLAGLTDAALEELGATHEQQPAVREAWSRALVVGRILPARLVDIAEKRPIELIETDASEWLSAPTGLGTEGRCALLVELPTISDDDVRHLLALPREHIARRLVVYGFASRKTLERLMDGGAVCLKSSAATAEMLRNLESEPEGPSLLDVIRLNPLPSHRFSAGSVARLAALSPKLECECPNHIAQLVQDISAFEQYSLECEDRDPAERALHGRMRLLAANARALFEEAMAELARNEGLDLEEL